MRRMIVGLMITAIGTILAAPVLADDAEIAQRIVKKLRAQQDLGNLKGFNVGLRVEGGDAWLQGQVASEKQRKLALNAAAGVKGVKQVVNDLKVVAPVKVVATVTPPISHTKASPRTAWPKSLFCSRTG